MGTAWAAQLDELKAYSMVARKVAKTAAIKVGRRVSMKAVY